MSDLAARVKRSSRSWLERIGRLRPRSADALELVRGDPARFVGDVPPGSGLEPVQYRETYSSPRPPRQVADLVYTPGGMAWVGGALHEGMGLRAASLGDILARPRGRRLRRLPRGTILACETLYSFGDWVSEFLATLVAASPLGSPLLVPAFAWEKPYVRRDLAALGVEVVRVDRPVRVEAATVLYKSRPMHYWTAAEVAAYRRAFQVAPPAPRPGSAIYLSREGERGESGFRQYPSRQVAEILEPLGVRTVLARQTTQEQYRALADQAETVVADHGAAMFNMLFWNPRRVIELVNGAWWNNCFLFLAQDLGVGDYRLVDVDRLKTPAIAEDFQRYLAAPIRGG